MGRLSLPALLVAATFLGFATNVDAHSSSESYLTLRATPTGDVTGRWDIALRDLDHALGLDADGDARVVWGEIRSREAEIAAYALNHLALHTGQRTCGATSDGPTRIAHRGGAAYVVLAPVWHCPASADAVEVEYRLFEDLDPLHRGFVRVASGDVTTATVLGGTRAREVISLGAGQSLAAVWSYVREGVWHIWIGIDHVLFLVCLLLPAVAPRNGTPASLGAAGRRVAWVVTAFSAAHSVTLGLGVLGWLDLSARFVESAIAGSIVVVAAGNLLPRLRLENAALAFGFGLLHGLGFASVLGELFAPGGAETGAVGGILAPLLGFNLGVELGQLAIVAAFLPVAFALRNTAFYLRGVVPVGSAAMAGVALVWLAERLLEREWVTFL